jgi:hypothetical protein
MAAPPLALVALVVVAWGPAAGRNTSETLFAT